MSENLTLKDRLAGHMQKDDQIRLVNSDESIFHSAMEIALSDEPPVNWRATWIIENSITRNDTRVLPYINRLIAKLPGQSDGYQRELLKVLEKMSLDDEQEGRLFDVCMTIWERIGKIPSVRWVALRFILKTVKKYPDLWHEIEFLLQEEYLETLSPGIRHSLGKVLAKH